HVDLDCFFAQVETFDHPEWRGKPVIVGGERRPDGSLPRGIVCTSTYEARAFGVRTAMPLAKAGKLCPEGVFVRGRFDRYRDRSQEVFDVLQEFTKNVHKTGIDEGYIDATDLEEVAQDWAEPDADKDSLWDVDWPIHLARAMQKRVLERTGLTLSIGVGPNKFVAKIASAYRKPAGVTRITLTQSRAFCGMLEIGKLRGIGKKTVERLKRVGVHQGEDLLALPARDIASLLGSRDEASARRLVERASGVHDGSLSREGARRSISRDRTFREDAIADDSGRELMRTELRRLLRKVIERMQHEELYCGTIGVRLRFADFTTLQREHSFSAEFGATRSEVDLWPQVERLVLELYRRRGQLRGRSDVPLQAVRLVGVKASNLGSSSMKQLQIEDLFGLEQGETKKSCRDFSQSGKTTLGVGVST
ncbi:MAG: DNA polymerase IV, partial [Planctomycetota bacterium]